MRKKERVLRVIQHLKEDYPNAECALIHSTAYELMIATILSAQCTDERVNQVTQKLFKKYTSIEAFAHAELETLEGDVKSTGFYRNKAKSIKGACQLLNTKYNGTLPKTVEELIEFPGVGRKTANVVLGNAFNIASGVVVDTHVRRISQKLGLTKVNSPEKIELELNKLVPKQEWIIFPHLMIFHGRAICKARKQNCGACSLQQICPSSTS